MCLLSEHWLAFSDTAAQCFQQEMGLPSQGEQESLVEVRLEPVMMEVPEAPVQESGFLEGLSVLWTAY